MISGRKNYQIKEKSNGNFIISRGLDWIILFFSKNSFKNNDDHEVWLGLGQGIIIVMKHKVFCLMNLYTLQ